MLDKKDIIDIVPKRKVLFEKYNRMVFLEEFLIGKFHECKIKEPKPTAKVSLQTISKAIFYVSKKNEIMFQTYIGGDIIWINHKNVWSFFKKEFNDELKEKKEIKKILLKYNNYFECDGASEGHSPWWKYLEF